MATRRTNLLTAGYELDADGACAQLDNDELLGAAEDKGVLQFTLSRGMALAYNPSFNPAAFNNDHSRYRDHLNHFSRSFMGNRCSQYLFRFKIEG
jgi:hypothetical protein